MAAILPKGKTQFFDANGNPLAGGFVTFYARGTTTLQATYQDYLLTIPNTNPVVLDASGQALIWGSGVYTMLVQDQYLNQIYQADTSDGSPAPYPSTGTELNMIRVNSAGTAYEFRTPAQVLSDVGALSVANGQPNGLDGTNWLPISAPATLTAAQSGRSVATDNFTAAGTITTPANVKGLNYRIYGCSAYAITVAAASGNIILSNGTSASSFVLPLSNEAFIEISADGTNWRGFASTQLITPTSSILGNGGVVYTTSTTLTVANSGQLISYNGAAAGTLTLPLASAAAAYSLPLVVTNISLYNVTMALQGSNTSDVSPFIIPPGQQAAFINDGVSVWRQLWNGAAYTPVNFATPINNTSAATDLALSVGQSAYITVASATSVPLHIVCGDNQLFEVTLQLTEPGSSASANTYLEPNNTTYSSAFSNQIMACNSGTFGGSGNTASYFLINGVEGFAASIKISTKIISKYTLASVVGSGNIGLISSWWNDTTTAWNSLGTIVFPVSVTGQIVIKRVV
ncbi:MAG TPA: hypothetical protein PLI96_07950 [Halothiobacillus sp.]|nr:hypothetical protein [Halothiobacillus sp.]